MSFLTTTSRKKTALLFDHPNVFQVCVDNAVPRHTSARVLSLSATGGEETSMTSVNCYESTLLFDVFLSIQRRAQAGDRGVADKQYMVDNNGNIVDVVSYCKKKCFFDLIDLILKL